MTGLSCDGCLKAGNPRPYGPNPLGTIGVRYDDGSVSYFHVCLETFTRCDRLARQRARDALRPEGTGP